MKILVELELTDRYYLGHLCDLVGDLNKGIPVWDGCEDKLGTIQRVKTPGRYKRCYKCSQVVPLSEFYSDVSRSDLLENKCKTCSRAASKSRYERSSLRR